MCSIKGDCQSETKAAHCYSCTDLTLAHAPLEGLSGSVHFQDFGWFASHFVSGTFDGRITQLPP